MTNDQIFELIVSCPGASITEVADKIFAGKPNRRSKFFAKLASLEASGHLVYTDQDLIYPFRNVNTDQNYY